MAQDLLTMRRKILRQRNVMGMDKCPAEVNDFIIKSVGRPKNT